jgi:hypothetical protein
VTTYSDCASLKFTVAPMNSRSSRAGSRWTIFVAVFLTTPGRILTGICSATTRPSP